MMNDLLLNIDTSGIDESKEDYHHNRYEPTPYEILDRLIASGYLSKENTVVDYGCGKGRVALYLNHQIGCKTIGIDYNDALIDIANFNKESLDCDVEFICMSAEKYEISNEDCFYFFNPFSEKILRRVMNQIIDSIYEYPRKIRLFFYYPDDEYISYLMRLDEFMCIDEIDCMDLYEKKDIRERILIFENFDE